MAILTEEHSALEDKLLLEEITALLSGAEACIQRSNATQANTQLLREGFRKTHSLYRAAQRDLKVLYTFCRCNADKLQKFRLAEGFAKQVLKCQQGLPFSLELADHEKPVQDVDLGTFIGSTENKLGITEELLSSSAGSRLHSEAQAVYTELLSEIEARLEERRCWLSEILQCPGQIVDETALLVSTLEASQQQHLTTLLGLAEDMKYYIELLSSFLEQQAKFVSERKLKSQKEIDFGENSCLIAACKTQALKIQVIERRLLAVTYTGQTVPALKAVSQHLSSAEAEAEANLQKVSAQVQQYEQLGPEFEALTVKYHKLLEDLRHAEFTLQEFQHAATNSNDSP